MAEKMTTMVLKVDLQCRCCCKRVKKIISKFPEIRNQVYDEKGNKITITLLSCCPGRIRDKLYYKGNKVIKSIEIIEPEKKKDTDKPKEPEKPKEKPKEPEKPKGTEKPKEVEKPKEADKPKEKPKESKGTEKPKEVEKPKEADKPKEGEKPKEAPKMPEPIINEPKKFESIPVNGFPTFYPVQAYYEAPGGVQSYQGYGVPPPPQPSYYGYSYEQYGGNGQRQHVERADYYFNDENSQGCSIM